MSLPGPKKMQVFEHKIFDDVDDRPLFPWQRGRTLQDAEFRHCRFQSCSISVTADPGRRSRARSLKFSGCTTLAVSIYSLVVEEVLVEDLVNEQLVKAAGAVFKHVILRGRIGSIMIRENVGQIGSPSQRAILEQANREYYSAVDWALDISEAEFDDVDLRGVPGHLIRRDPESQVLVTREKACEGRWKQLNLADTHWPLVLNWLAESKRESEVLVAGKRSPDYRKLLDGLNRLRDLEVAQ